MATKTLYFKDAVPAGATLHRSLQDGGVAPTAATTTTGWNAGTDVLGQSCLQNGGTEVARNAGTWGTTLQPSAAPSQTVGDCWRSENTIAGTFANTNWSFNWQVQSVTAAYTGRFKLAVRLWRSTNANGSGATEITAGRVTSAATAANLSTSVDTAVAITWTPGATVTLNNEYLFINVGIEITSAGGGTTQDMDFRVGSTATVVTPDFGAAQTLTPLLFTAANAIYVATVTPGAVSLISTLFTDADSFFAPTVSSAYGITPGLFADGDTFYSAAVAQGSNSQSLTPSLFTDSAAFYAADVGRGAVALDPALFADSAVFYPPTVSASITLVAALATNAAVFPAATVGRGDVALVAGLISNSNSAYAAAVDSSVSLSSGRIDESNTFYAPTVLPGHVDVLPTLFANSQAFYVPIVQAILDVTVSAPFVVNDTYLYEHMLFDATGGFPLAGKSEHRPLPSSAIQYPVMSDSQNYPLSEITRGYP